MNADDLRVLQMVDAYWKVWIEWSTDKNLIELSGPVRRGKRSVWQRINKLKKNGYISDQSRPTFGGGVAYPLTELGQAALLESATNA